jgi:hypothetical protein
MATLPAISPSPRRLKSADVSEVNDSSVSLVDGPLDAVGLRRRFCQGKSLLSKVLNNSEPSEID